MCSDVEDNQPTVRYKENLIDITWTGYTPSAQLSEISDNEDTAITQEEPRGMGLCIPISSYKDQEDEAEDAQPSQVTFNMD